MIKIKRVGFVATGDEIIVGDIVNTNVAYFAQQLKLSNIVPGKQITVADNENDIRDAILYIQQDHDCIITIGGLGPTKDDLTRNGLAAAVNLPLEFYEEPWQWIARRFAERNIPLTDNNRQQAFLPKGSLAIHNTNGSACACYLEHQGKDYFMLPGPPNECYSLFDEAILPRLKAKNYQRSIFRKIWLLFGVSESKIADSLEKIPENGCEIGYRVNYPYLEIKLACENEADLKKTAAEFDSVLNEFSISNERICASQQLISSLEKSNKTICIDDQATGGRFQNLIYTPKTAEKVNFGGAKLDLNIQIRGLQEYWQNKKTDHYRLELIINGDSQKLIIPVRGQNSLVYACELVAMKLLSKL